ncbi:hypothetical protein ABZP36_019439 [Zizania latifolia]
MLSGQVADGLMTILAGEMIDRFGHFKLWHIGGSMLVGVSFSSVFGGCLLCIILGTDSYLLRTIGYSLFAAVFNIGWDLGGYTSFTHVNGELHDTGFHKPGGLSKLQKCVHNALVILQPVEASFSLSKRCFPLITLWFRAGAMKEPSEPLFLGP